MMIKFILFYITLVFSTNILAQVDQFSKLKPKSINLLSSYELKNARFYSYDSTFKIKAIYQSKDEVDVTSVEGLMTSLISVRNREWDNFNRLPEKAITNDKKYNIITSDNIEKVYYQLLHKFQFEFNGIRTVYVKYAIVEKNERRAIGLAVLKFINNRWYLDGFESGTLRVTEPFTGISIKLSSELV